MSLKKADEFMTVAVYCLDQGHANASASRAYYAMFHAATTVLEAFGIGDEGKWSHEGLQAALARELIHRRKVLPAHLASYLTDTLGIRVKADYGPESIKTREAQRALAKAQEFVAVIKEKLP